MKLNRCQTNIMRALRGMRKFGPLNITEISKVIGDDKAYTWHNVKVLEQAKLLSSVKKGRRCLITINKRRK